MQLHELKTIHKSKKSKRIGRGGKRGTYSGKGIKGQTSRAGKNYQPIIRELIKRYPKLRGYRQKRNFNSQKSKIAVLNLDDLDGKFNAGDKISPEILLENKIIRRIKGRVPEVKILSRGRIGKNFLIEGCLVSEKAKKEIEKAGGTVTVKE